MTLDLRALPKAELHVHLESTIGPATVTELAARHGKPVPAAGPFAGLTEFVVAYERARDLVGSLGDLHRLAVEFGARQRSDGVVWSEVHLVPTNYGGRLGDPDGLVEAVLDGLGSGAGAERAGLVLGVNRASPVEEAELTVDLALRWAGRGVVALGLAGDEANHPAATFAQPFARAVLHGLPTVPHAGEGSGPASVRATVEKLAPSRICHGVRAVEDDALVGLLAEQEICLDLAPTSNVELGVVADLANHPLPRLMRAGVPVTLNSDIPLFVGHGLLGEYERCAEAWSLGDSEILAIARHSIRHSFCSAGVRADALRELDAVAETALDATR